MSEETQQCSKCGQDKPLVEFGHRLSAGKYIRKRQCNACKALYVKCWRAVNLEKAKAIAKKSRLAHIIVARKRSADWKKLNPERANLHCRRQASKGRAQLADFYIKKIIRDQYGLSSVEIIPEMIQAKRGLLQAHRRIKQCTSGSK